MQGGGQFLFLAVLFAFAVWMFSRGRRQQREMQATQARLRPGTEVKTTSGVYATVVEVADDGTLRLETSPGVVSRWDRRAVARITSTPDEDVTAEEPSTPAPVAEPGPEPEPIAGSHREPEPSARTEPRTAPKPTVPPEPGAARPAQDTLPPDRD
ncbi:MAG TPA: preprotein translocase subunit YajC [Kineosporiaceae bacterium]|nr:preprotein translocase subunit YajC [Kineosporiaceae bacterium]